MILKEQEIIDRQYLVGDEGDGLDMDISKEDMGWIISSLGKLYKDPYSAILQEYLSNSFDATIEANKTTPIVLQIKKDVNDKWYIAFQDYGVGISTERIKIFAQVGKSTKRNSEKELGCYGIGKLSYLSYTNQLYIDTVYDGIEYKYFISPSTKNIPHIELLYSQKTDLENQTRIWFYLKPDVSTNSYSYGYTDTEAVKFHKGAKRKTAYFENLVYDFDSSLDDLNKYKRFEGKYFVYSQMVPSDYLQILIGQVPYEIDFNLLGIPHVNVPIAIKVKDVYPSRTRESVYYTDEAKENIKLAIREAATELVRIYNKQVSKVTDWKEWLRLRAANTYIMIGPDKIYINSIIKYSDEPLAEIVFEPLAGLDMTHFNADNIFPFYISNVIKKGRKGDYNGASEYGRKYGANFLRLEGILHGKKNTYIYSEIDSDDIYVLKKRNLKLKQYVSLLNLKRDDRANWRKKIVQYQNFVNSEWESIKSYDDIVIPKEYLQKIRVNRQFNKPSSSVTYYELTSRANYSSDFKTSPEVKYATNFNHKALVIYGLPENKQELDYIWRCFIDKTKVKIIYLAKSNFKYLDSHQYVNVKNWHKTKAFSRIITAYKINQLLHQYRSLTDNSADTWYKNKKYSWLLKGLSTEFASLLDELTAYGKKNCDMQYVKKDFMNNLLQVAESEKLWDYSIYYKIDKLESYLKRFEFVQCFREEEEVFNKVQRTVAIYIKKVTKDVRLDLKWYQHKTFENV